MPTPIDLLEMPPSDLAAGDGRLRLGEIVPGDASRDLVPYYHFRILTADDQDVGHINFRVGDTEHVRLFAGHIGFGISEPFRGRGLAEQACRAIAPFVRTIYVQVVLTCDPDNGSSQRTIEKLGARFLEDVSVPARVSHCDDERIKRRYQWTV